MQSYSLKKKKKQNKPKQISKKKKATLEREPTFFSIEVWENVRDESLNRGRRRRRLKNEKLKEMKFDEFGEVHKSQGVVFVVI